MGTYGVDHSFAWHMHCTQLGTAMMPCVIKQPNMAKKVMADKMCFKLGTLEDLVLLLWFQMNGDA